MPPRTSVRPKGSCDCPADGIAVSKYPARLVRIAETRRDFTRVTNALHRLHSCLLPRSPQGTQAGGQSHRKICHCCGVATRRAPDGVAGSRFCGQRARAAEEREGGRPRQRQAQPAEADTPPEHPPAEKLTRPGRRAAFTSHPLSHSRVLRFATAVRPGSAILIRSNTVIAKPTLVPERAMPLLRRVCAIRAGRMIPHALPTQPSSKS